MPANFDLIDCCYRQYLWSGDRDDAQDGCFLHFYARSLNEYVRRWDRDGDGIPDHVRGEGPRGIASYVEDALTPKVAGDLVAAQYAAYAAYAAMSRLRGEDGEAEQYEGLATGCERCTTRSGGTKAKRRFNGAILQDGAPYPEFYLSASYMPLYFGLIAPGEKRRSRWKTCSAAASPTWRKCRICLGRILRFGRAGGGVPDDARAGRRADGEREYPEVSYSVIGNIVTGLLGIR